MTTTIILNGKELTFQCNSELSDGIFSTSTSTIDGDAGLGEMFLCKIAWMLVNGIYKCYDNIDEYMVDAIMDLSWTEEGYEICKNHIQNHKHFEFISGIFSEKYPDCEMIS